MECKISSHLTYCRHQSWDRASCPLVSSALGGMWGVGRATGRVGRVGRSVGRSVGRVGRSVGSIDGGGMFVHSMFTTAWAFFGFLGHLMAYFAMFAMFQTFLALFMPYLAIFSQIMVSFTIHASMFFTNSHHPLL